MGAWATATPIGSDTVPISELRSFCADRNPMNVSEQYFRPLSLVPHSKRVSGAALLNLKGKAGPARTRAAATAVSISLAGVPARKRDSAIVARPLDSSPPRWGAGSPKTKWWELHPGKHGRISHPIAFHGVALLTGCSECCFLS